MQQEFAILDRNRQMVCHTPAYSPDGLTRETELSDGCVLSICGTPSLDAENEQLHRQLAEALAENASKEAFLSSMSHDIRTPMNAIVGLTELAKKHIDEKARVWDALEKIETASGHLLSLINDVLDMSRINSGRMQIVSEPFSLSDLLHDIMTIAVPQMVRKGHAHQLVLGDIPHETLRGDVLRLRQIYVNIISNAVKYTNEHGEIILTIDEQTEGDMCRLLFTCQDNGIGMTQDFLNRIFIPFERVNNAQVARIEGTGLGMSIVKKIIDAMNGEIDITSQPGQGTTVRISIPLPWEAESIQTSALDGQKLLILEADSTIRLRYAQIFEKTDIRCVMAKSAGEAVSLMTEAEFTQSPFSLLIIGRKLADNSTYSDAAAYFSKACPHLPIVLVSDARWEEIEYQARRCGISGFIPLPFFRKSLLNGLNHFMTEQHGPVQNTACPDLSGRRILLVEDNMINREIAKEILSVTGAGIDTAENGREAVETYTAAADGSYNLILMDIQMPVMDGYEATGRIRSSGKSDAASVPIYAMTANTFAEDIARARDAGMNGHISKPIDTVALMQLLRKLL